MCLWVIWRSQTVCLCVFGSKIHIEDVGDRITGFLLMDQTAVQQLCVQLWENVCVGRLRGGVLDSECVFKRKKSSSVIYAAPPTPQFLAACVSAEVCWRENKKIEIRRKGGRTTMVEQEEALFFTCTLTTQRRSETENDIFELMFNSWKYIFDLGNSIISPFSNCLKSIS